MIPWLSYITSLYHIVNNNSLIIISNIGIRKSEFGKRERKKEEKQTKKVNLVNDANGISIPPKLVLLTNFPFFLI
jgi:hypothetical protein